jgi:uncharacterized protein (TIGR03084 family)
MLAEARDFADECAVLNTLLVDVPADRWETPTQFKAWTINDVIGHLHLFDYAANLSLESTEALKSLFQEIRAGRERTGSLTAFTLEWLDGRSGPDLRDRWYQYAGELAARYAGEDPRRRAAWGGPDMSTRSLISARQMETWAHGQAVFDELGVERQEADRLRNVAVIGVNTFAWSFANRKEPIPAERPLVRLTAPSGALWEWNPEETVNRVEGSAVDFCRVVTQTRNVADTGLEVSGEVATRWMAIAQCFAGPPEQPPPPGTRQHRPSKG